MEDGRKTVDIMVVGDLVQDNNLIHNEKSGNTYSEIITTSVLETNLGGAWYLTEMIHNACDEFCPDKVIVGPPELENIRKNKSLGQAYQVWSRCEDDVFRISQFLGCPQAEKPFWQPEQKRSAKILVIDDLGMGYLRFNRDDGKVAGTSESGDKEAEFSVDEWLANYNPEEIILKTVLQDDADQFLASLNKKYFESLTVVVPALALRTRGARISEGLSWDSTLEDTVNEFASGTVLADLARFKRVVIVYSHEAVAVMKKGKLERFIFDAKNIEGAFKNKRSGTIYGLTSIVTAALARHLSCPETFPLFLAMGRSLAAARKNVEIGGALNKDGKFQFDKVNEEIKEVFNFNKDRESEPAAVFSASVDHSLLADEDYRDLSPFKSDLLADFAGKTVEFVAAKASEIVVNGPDKSLSNVPMAKYGFFTTVDRQEIERLNAIRNLIIDYKNNPGDKRPLSIAVFGPPGSGKSFAIKEIAADIFKKDKSIIEFNLSQFNKNIASLHNAFHVVRDASIKGSTPLVFWDEFDSDGLFWLKEFLAPMQDVEFMSEGISHPFGRAIFIFAGGVSKTFAEFANEKEHKGLDFAQMKGPDFVSRLRGYLNVKGPNPSDSSDPAHLIRRAILIRSLVERSCKHLIDRENKRMHINAGVLKALLMVDKYLHGARSMESIIRMSHLVNHNVFVPACLPDRELLKLHVSEDFVGLLEKGKLEQEWLEMLAEACHEAWRKEKEDAGYRYGKERDDEKKTHHQMLDYARLDDDGKENNRLTVRLTEAKLAKCNMEVLHKKDCNNNRVKKIEGDILNKLVALEHDTWLRDKLLNGYAYAPKTDDSLFLHKDIKKFEELGDEEIRLDRVIVGSIIPSLEKFGFVVAEKETKKRS